MAIRPKGAGWQVDVTWRGKRAPRIVVPTEIEAKRLEVQFKADLMAGRIPQLPSGAGPTVKVEGTWTLGRLQAHAMTHHWRGHKSEDSSERTSGAWLTALGGDFPVTGLTAAVIEDTCHTWAVAGSRPSTINRKLAALSVMLKIAHKRGIILSVPQITKGKEYEGRIRWFTPDEELSLVRFIRDDLRDYDLADLVVVAVDTGFRYGELMRLTPGDRSEDGERVTAWETKGNRPRTLPLTPRARLIIETRAEGMQSFLPMFDLTRLNNSYISRVIGRWKTLMGLDPQSRGDTRVNEQQLIFKSCRANPSQSARGEMVNTADLNSAAPRLTGSSPVGRTTEGVQREASNDHLHPVSNDRVPVEPAQGSPVQGPSGLRDGAVPKVIEAFMPCAECGTREVVTSPDGLIDTCLYCGAEWA